MKEQSQTGENFIRAYSLDDDSPKVILFTDEQLADIANFCCTNWRPQVYPLRWRYLPTRAILCACYVIPQHNALHKTLQPPCLSSSIRACSAVHAEGQSHLTLFQKMTAKMPGLKDGLSTSVLLWWREATTPSFGTRVRKVCCIPL